MVTKEQLIRLIELGQEEILRFAGSLTEEEREAGGSRENWGGRDTLAHVAEWKRYLTTILMQAQRGEKPVAINDLEAANGEIVESYRLLRWEELLVLVQTSHERLIAQIQAFSEAELNDPAYYTWQQNRPMWRTITGSGFLHANGHIAPAYIERGEAAEATRLREQEAREVMALDTTSSWQGIAHYNLACHYATIGEKAMALEKLEKGFELYPDLVAYSQQDLDLASLHKDPDYLALVEKMGSLSWQLEEPLTRERLIQALEPVLERLQKSGAAPQFRLVGTGAALLHGVNLAAGDIDLLAGEREGVDAFAAALEGYRCVLSPTYLGDARQYITEFEVEGVKVEVSTVEWETSSDAMECFGAGPWTHYKLLPCGAYQVPTVALELHLISELARGRRDRYLPVAEFLAAQGSDLALVKRGMDERQVPEVLQAQMLEALKPSVQLAS